jgi:uncharacterized protein
MADDHRTVCRVAVEGRRVEVGRVDDLWRYPVKSMQGEPIAAADLGVAGVPGDRRWALHEVATGRLVTGKRVPRVLEAVARLDGDAALITLPDGTVLSTADPGASALLSDWLDAPVRLDEATDGAFVDDSPAHLLTRSSLAAMRAAEPEVRWDLRRFRPTVLVASSGAGFIEDGWVGRALGIGAALLHVAMPTVRCAMPARRHGDVPADIRVTAALRREHAALLGVYCTVTLPGAVAVGDPVRLAGGPLPARPGDGHA